MTFNQIAAANSSSQMKSFKATVAFARAKISTMELHDRPRLLPTNNLREIKRIEAKFDLLEMNIEHLNNRIAFFPQNSSNKEV